MVKSPTDDSHGSTYRHVETEQTEDDQIKQPPIVGSQAERKRILVVDDNSDIGFTLRLGLENGDTTMQIVSSAIHQPLTVTYS